jgi:hypothetical protein
VGESQGPEVSRKTSEEGPAQNECSRESQNWGGSQSALEEGQSRRQKDVVVSNSDEHYRSLGIVTVRNDWSSVQSNKYPERLAQEALSGPRKLVFELFDLQQNLQQINTEKWWNNSE